MYQIPTQSIPAYIVNRRYKRLQQLIDEDEYFSEEAIRIRDPLMYFLYVGQYKRNGDKKAEFTSLADLLIEQVQRNEYELLLQQEHDKVIGYPELTAEESIECEELEDNIDMLVRLMHEKFMNGLDKDVNYELIDLNQQHVKQSSLYDDDRQIDRDNEEEYFEKMSVESEEAKQASQDTGILDY